MIDATKYSADDFVDNINILSVDGVSYSTKGKRKLVNLKDILIKHSKNKVRYEGFSRKLIADLKQSYNDYGIRTNEFLPILEELSATVPAEASEDGNRKFYEPVDGFNRLNALLEMGVNEYWFDVVEFKDPLVDPLLAKLTLALMSNNPPPRGASNDQDMFTTAVTLVVASKINNDHEDIKKWLMNTCKIPAGRAAKLSSKVCKQTGGNVTYIQYSEYEIKNVVGKKFGIKTHGAIDPDRDNKAGYTCLERYEKDAVVSAMIKFARTGKHSYFVLHEESPTPKKGLEDRRENSTTVMKDFVDSLLVVSRWIHEHDYKKVPFEILGFFPQNTKDEDMNEIIPYTKTNKDDLL